MLKIHGTYLSDAKHVSLKKIIKHYEIVIRSIYWFDILAFQSWFGDNCVDGDAAFLHQYKVDHFQTWFF